VVTMTTKNLIKTIEGADCKIFAVKNHQRFFVGKATPKIEIYQNVTEVEVLGKVSSEYKTYEFSVIICSNPELAEKIRHDFLSGVSYFDLETRIKQKNNAFIPFEFNGLTSFSIDEFDEWVFNVDDYELTQRLLKF